MVPAMLVVPVIAVALWALIGNQKDGWAVVRAGVGALVAIPLLFPWFGVVDLSSYLKDGGPIFLNPWWPAVAVVGAVAMSVLLGSAGRLASVAGWGATLGAAGILAARAGEFEAGRDIRTTGMILASIGTAAVVGAALEAGSRIETVVTWRRLVTAVGVLGAVLAVASTAVFAGPGRAGLPSDELRSGLRFTLAQGGPPELSRVLLAGPAETLPGDHRLLDGAPYRVVTAPYPRLWEARLAEPRLGDAELEATLRDIVEGKVARAGEALAPFGIKWVVITGASPFSTVFDGQLDLVPLTGLSQEVLLSEVDARRIVPDSGGLWVWEGPDYAGPGIPGTQVYLAENADQRWVPKDSTGIWAQDSWANRVSVDSGVISFTGPPEYRREALVALGLLLLLLALSIIGTGRRAR